MRKLTTTMIGLDRCTFDLCAGGENEHTELGLVVISPIFAVHDIFFFGTEPVDWVEFVLMTNVMPMRLAFSITHGIKKRPQQFCF